MNMMFSKPRANIPLSFPRNNSTNSSLQQQFYLANIARKSNLPQQTQPPHTRSIVEVQPTTQTTNTTDITKKKMKWGEPVWFFFHTIGEKIKPESFQIIRNELLRLCISICHNLPCPTCSAHAKDYLNQHNLNVIQTPEQFKEFFYVFHNTINKKKGFAEFPRELLQDKYSKANTINIFNYFLVHFLDKSYSIRMIADDFHRQRLVVELREWLNNNVKHFLP